MRQIKAKVEVLSQAEIEMIHGKTLQLLERVGIRVPNDEVLDLCHAYGANIDKEKKLLKIPPAAMEAVIASNKDMRDKEDYTISPLYGNISTEVFVVDFESSTQRYGTMDDVMRGIHLVEKLDYIRAANSVAIPADVPAPLAEVESFRAIYGYSTKPGGTYVLSPFTAKYVLPMADVMGLKHHYLLETISPLMFREESLEIALMYAKAGHPMNCAPMAIAGATAPISLSGTLVVENAEVLGTLFIINALTQSLAAHTASCHSMDMRTMLCSFGSPNQALLGVANAQLSRYYGLESRNNCGLTDAIRPDFQAGFEKGATTLMSHLAGCGEVGCQGIVGADQGFSYEQLVIDNEWLRYYNYILKGTEISEESIDIDMIERVGIGGNFLTELHTAYNMKDNYWPSQLFFKDTWEQWIAGGKKDILDNAHAYVKEVMADYDQMQPVIEASKMAEIDAIAEQARAEYKSTL